MKLTLPEAGAPTTDSTTPFIGGGLNVRECGAVGNGQATCTAAIQRAIDRCAQAGGGTVIVPAGHYVTGTLWPDFGRTDLLSAILEYQKRDRRFGGLSVEVESPDRDEWVEAVGTIAR